MLCVERSLRLHVCYGGQPAHVGEGDPARSQRLSARTMIIIIMYNKILEGKNEVFACIIIRGVILVSVEYNYTNLCAELVSNPRLEW